METLKNPGFNFPVISGLAAIIITGMLLIFVAGLLKNKPVQPNNNPPSVIIKYTKPPELPDQIQEEEATPKPLDPVKNVVSPEKIKYETVMPDPFTNTDGPGTIKVTTLEPGKHIIAPTKIREIFTPKQVDRAPSIIRPVTPVYPFDAKAKGVEGRVVLRFVVDENGHVQAPEVVKADPAGVFEESAIAAILKYRFEPAVIGNKKVKCYVVVPVGFRLN